MNLDIFSGLDLELRRVSIAITEQMELEMTSIVLLRTIMNAQNTEGEVYHALNQLNPKKSCPKDNQNFVVVEIVNDLNELSL